MDLWVGFEDVCGIPTTYQGQQVKSSQNVVFLFMLEVLKQKEVFYKHLYDVGCDNLTAFLTLLFWFFWHLSPRSVPVAPFPFNSF